MIPAAMLLRKKDRGGPYEDQQTDFNDSVNQDLVVLEFDNNRT